MVTNTTPIAQLSFCRLPPGAADWPDSATVRNPTGRRRAWIPPELAEFQRRCLQRGLSAKTAASQMRSLRSMLKAVRRQLGREIGVLELFRNAELLATAACDSARLDGRPDGELTHATLGSRRIAARSFYRLMEDLVGSDADSMTEAFEEALRGRYRLVGQRYLPTNGRTPGRKIHTPTLDDIENLIRYVASGGKAYRPKRNAAFVMFVASMGLRLSSAVEIDGADFRGAGSGLTVFVREKSRPELQERHVPAEVAQAMRGYAAAHNRYLADYGFSQRIGFGIPGRFWRSPPSLPWSPQAAEKMIRYASSQACSREFAPHAIRRFTTQELIRVMSRQTVTDALGWITVTTPDEHYAPPPGSTLPHEPQEHLQREGRYQHVAPSTTAA